ncbi:MAG TPA: hypothetical protein VFF13_03095 [archaeon]|nr:hypothetical protein [archaeon]
MNFIRGIVDSQYNKANMGLGLVFFLFPFLLLVLLSVFIGLTINFGGLLLAVAKELVYWILATLLLIVLLIVFKGKDASISFPATFSAFSVIYLINAIAGFFVFLLINIFIPGFFQRIASLQGQNITFEQMLSVVSSIALPSQEIQIILFGLLILIGIVAFFAGLHVYYRIGTLSKKTSGFSNLIMLVLFVGIAFVLNNFLSFVFSLF